MTFTACVELGCLSFPAKDYSVALSFEKENPVGFVPSFIVHRAHCK